MENGGARSSVESCYHDKAKPAKKPKEPSRYRSSTVSFMINAINRKSSRSSLQNSQLLRESNLESIDVQDKPIKQKNYQRNNSRTKLIQPFEEESTPDDRQSFAQKKNSKLINSKTSATSAPANTKSSKESFQSRISTKRKSNDGSLKSGLISKNDHNLNKIVSPGRKEPNKENNSNEPEYSAPEFASTSVKRSSKATEDCDKENISKSKTLRVSELSNDSDAETGNRRKRTSVAECCKCVSRRYLLAAVCPCFNYYILKEDMDTEKATEQRYHPLFELL